MGIELKKFDTRLQAEGPEVTPSRSGLRRRSTCRSPTKCKSSRPPTGPACRCCSRAPPAAARRASSSTWRIAVGARTAPTLITVACHEDLTGSDLVGRYLIQGGETVWVDGPLTQAVRQGAICYLDEIVEARKDTTVLIHPLADHRRILPIDKLGETLPAHPGFLLVISYNPGYQSIHKDLKHSTRQRFVTIEFDYPPADKEVEIIAHEAGVDPRGRCSWRSWAKKCGI